MHPTLHSIVGDNHILWFQKSNKYILVNSYLFDLIDEYIQYIKNGRESLSENLKNLDKEILKNINDLIEDCNSPIKLEHFKSIDFENSHRNITSLYKASDFSFRVNYSSEKLKSIIHPQISHLRVNKNIEEEINCVFDVFIKDKQIHFFKNEILISNHSVDEFHLFQGKFCIELLSSIHNNEEKDWLGTFHASTVSKDDESIMLIGNSGSGKSTFSALAIANNYNLVADDFSPMLREDKKIYSYPAAISIKSGAFDTLNAIIPNFEAIEKHYVNPYKGFVKYVSNDKRSYTKGYTCNKVVLINYQKTEDTNTSLEEINFEEALRILIPESWLEPSLISAKAFISWLKTVTFYKLTYNNNQEGILAFSKLFK